MIGMRRLSILLLAPFALVSTAAAVAQSREPVSALKGHNSNAPIDLTADRLEVQDRADRAMFTGNVKVRQDELSLDTSSSPQARIQAIRALKVWGTCCFVGEGNEVTIDVSPDMLRRQATLIGSWTFSTTGQAECARFALDRGIAVDALFTDRWRLDEAAEAYALFDRQTGGKGVFLI